MIGIVSGTERIRDLRCLFWILWNSDRGDRAEEADVTSESWIVILVYYLGSSLPFEATGLPPLQLEYPQGPRGLMLNP